MDPVESSGTDMEVSPIKTIERAEERREIISDPLKDTELTETLGNTLEQATISTNYESHRAKAFILNTESNDWDEMATGICSPEPLEVIKTLRLNN